MKNKFQFIIPRLLVVTAVVGIVTLLVGFIFKILLVASILFSISALIYSKVRRHKYQDDTVPAFARTQAEYFLPYSKHAIVPVQYANKSSKPTIIPIY